jgi:hypothetical protein
MSLGGQSIPDLEVGFSQRLDRLPLRVGGMLGLDFLSQFTDIALDRISLPSPPHLPSVRLTFTDP